MPVTFPAHQAFVLPLKLLWPRRFDATALCIAAAAPDLGYPLAFESHSLAGAILFAVPLTLVLCALIRWRAAAVVFGNVPDLGPLRLQSYRVLGDRRPGVGVTFVSATIGAVSHVFIDSFTHAGRWGANLLDLDDHVTSLAVRGDMTEARVLQYLGHTVGSVVAIALFVYIGRRRLLEEWYGADRVSAARDAPLAFRQRLSFWAVTAAVTLAVTTVGIAAGRSPVFSPLLGVALGLVASGCLTICGARSATLSRSRT